MFEVNGIYANRIGNYTVLAMSGTKMTVRYEDGKEAVLNVGIQERIWENILAEREAVAAKQRATRKYGAQVKFYIKTLSISEEADLSIMGLRQRNVVASQEVVLNPGDRLIYFAVEPALFFAVATITSKPRTAKAKDYLFGGNPDTEVFIYPIDVDAHILTQVTAIPVDSAELESLPNHKVKMKNPDEYFSISEDDFELLAELIMEVDAEFDADLDDDDDDDSEDEPEELLEIDE